MDRHNIALKHFVWAKQRAETLGDLWKTTCIHCLKEISNNDEGVCIYDYINFQAMLHKECSFKKMWDAAKQETNDE